MFEPLVFDRPRKPAAAEEAMLPCWSQWQCSRSVNLDLGRLETPIFLLLLHRKSPSPRLVRQPTIPSMFVGFGGKADIVCVEIKTVDHNVGDSKKRARIAAFKTGPVNR